MKMLRSWNVRSKIRLLYGALAVGAVLFLLSGNLANAQCTRCCFPAANVSVNPGTAEEGQPVVISTTVLNCHFPSVITVLVNVVPDAPCASFAEAFSFTVYVLPGRARTVTYTFAAPRCAGNYEVIETASNAPGTATKTLIVD